MEFNLAAVDERVCKELDAMWGEVIERRKNGAGQKSDPIKRGEP